MSHENNKGIKTHSLTGRAADIVTFRRLFANVNSAPETTNQNPNKALRRTLAVAAGTVLGGILVWASIKSAQNGGGPISPEQYPPVMPQPPIPGK